MRKDIFRGLGGCLLAVGLILALSLPALALDKRIAENPLLRHRGFAKPATAVEITCAVGNVYNRISNSTVEKSSGTNDWTIIMGDDSAERPSMRWQTPNNYASYQRLPLLRQFEDGNRRETRTFLNRYIAGTYHQIDQ